jgi:predicted  nucleic acid-binding Zn-ribbon protein
VETSVCQANEAHQHLLSHLHVLTTEHAQRGRLHADELEQLRQRIEKLAGELRELRDGLEDLRRRDHRVARESDDRLSRALTLNQSALAELSMELTDAQRRQADILERVVERVSALDRTLPPSPVSPAPPT